MSHKTNPVIVGMALGKLTQGERRVVAVVLPPAQQPSRPSTAYEVAMAAQRRRLDEKESAAMQGGTPRYRARSVGA